VLERVSEKESAEEKERKSKDEVSLENTM